METDSEHSRSIHLSSSSDDESSTAPTPSSVPIVSRYTVAPDGRYNLRTTSYYYDES